MNASFAVSVKALTNPSRKVQASSKLWFAEVGIAQVVARKMEASVVVKTRAPPEELLAAHL